MESKDELRKCVRQQVKCMTMAERNRLSQAILQRVEQCRHFIDAQTVMLYYSLPDEVNTHEFVARWASSKTILLPVVKGDDLELRQYVQNGQMCETDFHIDAPVGDAFTRLEQIDMVLVPGVAFDSDGYRMGRGRGYYDRFLSQSSMLQAYRLGVCFPCQFVEKVPNEVHDVRMHQVITL